MGVTFTIQVKQAMSYSAFETVDLHGVVEGTGDEVVLLHPIGLDSTFWGPLPETLARSHRVLRLDLRGFGRSPIGDGPVPIRTYAADVHRAIVSHGFQRPTILGLSFGGMIAQVLALAHPSSVSRLVLCGCPGGIPEAARGLLRERGLIAERNGMEDIIEPTIARWFTPSFTDADIAEQVRLRLRKNSVRAWSEGWRAIADFNALPSLGHIKAPTLVVSGAFDAATSPEASAALAAAIPGAELVTVEDGPHMMQLETGAAFAETVAAFLARSEATVKG
jgi:3-oxoadipate enol-lactonase